LVSESQICQREYPKWEYPVIEFLAIRNCENVIDCII